MTTFIQLAAGALSVAFVSGHTGPIALTLLLALTAFTLNISVFHLGRPAYAWRALTGWRRSWLSREVLLFGLFFSSLAALTLLAWTTALHPLPYIQLLSGTFAVLSTVLGLAGIVASAYIYLVPARPAWNLVHTPVDFLLSAALLGTTATPLLLDLAANLRSMILHLAPGVPLLRTLVLPSFNQHFPLWPAALATALWIANHVTRLIRLNRSSFHEHRATASLLNSADLRGTLLVSFAFVLLALGLTLGGSVTLAPLAALAAVIAARYLFFVSVVPLNMALTFVRSVHA
jgi:DMSO reductase anchor subunit